MLPLLLLISLLGALAESSLRRQWAKPGPMQNGACNAADNDIRIQRFNEWDDIMVR